MNTQPIVRGWKSRKLWVFLLAFSVMCTAGFLGKLTIPFVIGLITVPAAYGMINVHQKKFVTKILTPSFDVGPTDPEGVSGSDAVPDDGDLP